MSPAKIPKSDSEYPPLQFKVNPKSSEANPFIELYSISAQRVTKVDGDTKWHTIKSEEVLPTSGKYSILFKTVRSTVNAIEVGVMPRKYKVEANKICSSGLGFHLGNGKIHDTNGVRDKKSTAWREVCPPIAADNLGVVAMEIDADEGTVGWKFNGTKFAESVITNYLKGKNMVAFISMAHKQDALDLYDYSTSLADFSIKTDAEAAK